MHCTTIYICKSVAAFLSCKELQDIFARCHFRQGFFSAKNHLIFGRPVGCSEILSLWSSMQIIFVNQDQSFYVEIKKRIMIFLEYLWSDSGKLIEKKDYKIHSHIYSFSNWRCNPEIPKFNIAILLIRTPIPRLMRIHLVRNSTSANFQNPPKIFT